MNDTTKEKDYDEISSDELNKSESTKEKDYDEISSDELNKSESNEEKDFGKVLDVELNESNKEKDSGKVSDTKPKSKSKTKNREVKKSKTMLIVESYFKQYETYIKNSKPDKAILSFSNIVLNLLKDFDPKACDYVIDKFKKNSKVILNRKVALQFIETFPNNNRIKIETFYVLIAGLIKPGKKKTMKIDFEKVRGFFQNQDVVNYFIKKYKK